ncbi:MAG: electron transfer flavoprotein subunit alpha/FixB family protein [Bdellovibrionales bacterium]|nr:electron transfer flavoprotein subunit alpha/FixB family protein [Bdellovibrionales bacterium]
MSGSLVVFIDQESGSLQKSGLVALTAARELQKAWGADALVALILGPGAKSAADKAKGYGFKEVFFSEDECYSSYRAVPFSLALRRVLEESGATAAVAAATTTGKDFFPRAAALVDAGQASDVIAVNSDGTVRRPMYAGDVFADVEVTTPVRFVTVRVSAFAPAEVGGAEAAVRELGAIEVPSFAGEVIQLDKSGGDRPELTDAEIVVSGGRALQSSENFEQYIFPLADALGAAVGASRAAVDSGYAPNDWQVGQTGKIVAPNLYVAVGISGAIQHLAGMKDSKVIVAINKDGEAPIFEVADYGLVADLYQVLPELTEKIRQARG